MIARNSVTGRFFIRGKGFTIKYKEYASRLSMAEAVVVMFMYQNVVIEKEGQS